MLILSAKSNVELLITIVYFVKANFTIFVNVAFYIVEGLPGNNRFYKEKPSGTKR